MREICLATGNAHKLAEVREILAPAGVAVRGLNEFAGVEPAVEDGDTFEHNARAKAETAARSIEMVVVADDSGLMVDSLGGAPGVYSARYAGRDGDHAANIAKLLAELGDVPDERRTARFVCVIAVAREGRKTRTYSGETHGRILRGLRGTGGFGYDPVFLSSDLGVSFAEARSSQKHAVSHRGRALARFAAALGAGELDGWFD
jgi:XTP/dITP diphosphohydrolase